MLCADHIYDAPGIEYALEDGTIEITVNALKDRLEKEILNIKRRFFIDPVFRYSKDKKL